MAWFAYPLGGFLVLLGLNEVFHTVLHPRGRGRLSHWVIRLFWRLGRMRKSSGTVAGVSGAVASIVAWVVLEVVGWALLILPLVPAGFTYSSGVRPSAYSPFAEAIYFSLVTFSTVGYGDVVVTDPVLRLLAPLEALTGFALVTASLSWFSQLYPALARRRTLAARLSALQALGASEEPFLVEPAVASVLTVLAGEVAQVTVDLQQNAETYYFREREAESTLPMMLVRLRRLIATVNDSEDEVLRWHAKVLQASLAQLVDVLRENLGNEGSEDTDSVILAVARDYGFPDRDFPVNQDGRRL